MNDTQTPAPTAASAPSRPPMRRPRTDRMIAGVAGALANYLGISVGIVRVAFVVLAFFGGSGVLLYGVGWLLIPEEGTNTPIAGSLFEDSQDLAKWVGIGLLAAAALVALSWTDLVRYDFLFAAGLLGVGVLLLRGDIGASKVSDPPPTSASDEPVSEPSASLPSEPSAPPPSQPPASPPPVSVSRPKPRPRSLLGGITFGAMLVTLGVMAALDVAGITRPSFSHYVAAVVMVAGAGLLVGTLRGRSYGLIAVGLLALPVLVFSTLVRIPFEGEIGDVTIQPVTANQIESPYDMAIGDMTLDLRLLERGEPVEIALDVGIGKITILLPQGRPAVVDASVGIGQLDLLGDDRGGFAHDERVTVAGDGSVDVVHITAETGIGALQLIVTES